MSAYKEQQAELERKYRKEIEGISRYNNVDYGVAFEMLRTNATLGGQYKGGGVAENWGEIQKDFKDLGNTALSDIAKDERLSKVYEDTKRVTGQSSKSTESNGTKTNTVPLGSNTIYNPTGGGGGGGGLFAGGGFAGIPMNDNTIGTIVGVGVLFMFVSMFRR